MKEMPIEYAVGITLAKEPSSQWEVPVVRLHAVDEVIAEAVWAMEWLEEEGPSGPMGNRGYQRTQTFLASDLVAQWRKRQEGKS
jgi:hypothetical protein